MRIISSFKDFYDVCRGFGMDPKLTYVRETSEIKFWHLFGIRDLKSNELTRMAGTLLSKLPPDSQNMSRGIIAFCGIAYPFHVLEGQVLYSREKIVEAAQKLWSEPHNPELKRRVLAELGITKKKRSATYRYQPRMSEKVWKKYEQETDLSVPVEVHLYFKAPVLLIPPGPKTRIIINPTLRPWNFVTIIDPYSAYQELSMYVGNDMVTQKDPNPPIPDKIKAESKGFDNWSFRKHKDDSKKPRRRDDLLPPMPINKQHQSDH